jgi:hypothetical protein
MSFCKRPGDDSREPKRSSKKIQPEREQADYDAWSAPPEEALQAVELARSFLTAIEALFEVQRG